jgi:hypothetical protein
VVREGVKHRTDEGGSHTHRMCECKGRHKHRTGEGRKHKKQARRKGNAIESKKRSQKQGQVGGGNSH